MPALALTDHGNLFAAIEFYQTMSKAGIKPLIGCECYLLPEGERRERSSRSQSLLTHLTLLVKNREGYQNLCRLITSSYLEGFYYKPRIDMELLAAHAAGLVALSGCLKGGVPGLFADDRDEDALKFAERLAEIFSGDRFYLEIMDHGLSLQQKVNEKLVDLGKKKGWPLVATNDVHYLRREDAPAHDALLCIQTGKNISDKKRMKMSCDEFYFKSPDEMSKRFEMYPEAIANTVELSKHLNLEFDFETYHFPKFEPSTGEDLKSYLQRLSREKLQEKFPKIALQRRLALEDIREIYEKRLERELEMITNMGFAGYFLIVADFIEFARRQRLPVGPGRGSAAGSIVAYCLGITNIDPLAHDLLFERFLNPERISMPDVDIDFCMRRRDEVIQYVAKKYGNVSQIITFGKMKARAVVRDVGRVLGMAYGDVDRIAKLIPATLGMTLASALEIEPRLLELAEENPKMKQLLEIARKLEGFPRHASTHAAGVVISDKALSDYVPLCRGQNDEVITQFDMKAVEKIGLIKFDFLGLKTLTVIDDTLRLIEKVRGEKIDIDTIPLDDSAVYGRLSEGDTHGIFQLESQGMTDLILKLKPNVFGDIVALVALFRPGPLGSGMVDDFINRKHGRIAIRYELPELEPILKDTYGVILYQEQVMRIASELAKFSLGDADLLRRAMGKKIAEEMDAQRERFVQGAIASGITPKKAEHIFDLMAKFAEYGFNKSHSAAYALVSYQTAYLKCHYPTEYMAALFTSEHGNADKILASIADCRAHQITILPPDVNESESDFSIVRNNVIRFGLGAVKNVGEAAVQSIVEAREQGNVFHSLVDFCVRVDSRKVNKRVIESLIKCGAFDFTKAPRAQLTAMIDQTINHASSHQRDRQTGQSRLFEIPEIEHQTMAQESKGYEHVHEWPEHQLLGYEKDSLGFYITGHPLTQFEDLLAIYSTSNTVTLDEAKDKQHVRFGGVVTRLREITTKRGDRMAFVSFEDLTGVVEVVVFADVYRDAITALKSEKPIFVVGVADAGDETVKVIAEKIYSLEEVPLYLTTSVHFFLRSQEATQKHLQQLKSILSSHQGSCPAYVHLVQPQQSETVLELPDDLKLAPSPQLIAAVEKLFGHDVTKFQSS